MLAAETGGRSRTEDDVELTAWQSWAKRLIDVVLAAVVLLLLWPVGVLVALLVRLTSAGPAIYSSKRVGQDNTLFTMYKFRTMQTETPEVATHLMEEPTSFLTPVGGALRKSSLDELPQLVNVLKGDMSLVGPRPALHNQHDLVRLRTEKRVHRLRPGITGLAQVSGRDSLSIPDKVDYEVEYSHSRSVSMDLILIGRTALSVLRPKSVSH